MFHLVRCILRQVQVKKAQIASLEIKMAKRAASDERKLVVEAEKQESEQFLGVSSLEDA